MPTDQQLKSALEWARRFGHTETGQSARWLADAYREEHATDDDEPITEAWLRSLRWDGPLKCPFIFSPEASRDGGLRLSYCIIAVSDIPLCEISIEAGGSDGEESFSIPQPETRGDVRRLCKSLGIPIA